MNRYVMSWSQADSMWMVVYAATLEDAEEMFEDGICRIAPHKMFVSEFFLSS